MHSLPCCSATFQMFFQYLLILPWLSYISPKAAGTRLQKASHSTNSIKRPVTIWSSDYHPILESSRRYGEGISDDPVLRFVPIRETRHASTMLGEHVWPEDLNCSSGHLFWVHRVTSGCFERRLNVTRQPHHLLSSGTYCSKHSESAKEISSVENWQPLPMIRL